MPAVPSGLSAPLESISLRSIQLLSLFLSLHFSFSAFGSLLFISAFQLLISLGSIQAKWASPTSKARKCSLCFQRFSLSAFQLLPLTSQCLIEVRYKRGLYLPELDLWLDPQGAKPRAFVSHAHADHFARHESILCSETTATLLHHRFRLPINRTDAHAYHSPIVLNGFRLRMLPAGHIPGSAMLHITRTADNASLLYTGDFKTRRSRTAEAVNFLAADTLIMETTFGLPEFVFPSMMEVETELLRFIHDAFADDVTPVLLGYSLGKSQEVLALLADNQIPVVIHPAAAAMTHACLAAGVGGIPEPIKFDGSVPPGHVLIAPPHALKTKLLKFLPDKRTAMLSGWALLPSAKSRYGVDVMIPFSDHADYPGLMECIQRVRPRRVLTVHGFAREFAADLRNKNIDAWCAAGGDQMELPMLRSAQRQATNARNPWHSRALCQLADFSDLCRLLAKTGSRVSRIEFVANYLKSLGNDDNLRHAVAWLSREFNPQSTTLNTPTLRHALLAIPGAREPRYHEILSAQKDPILATCAMLQELQLRPQAMTLNDTAEFLALFEGPNNSLDLIQRLADRLVSLHPAESETLLKLLIGNLGLTLDRSSITEAISQAFHANTQELQQAIQVTGSISLSAVLAKQKNLTSSADHAAQANASPNPIAHTQDLPFG